MAASLEPQRPFRSRYLRFDELTEQLRAWADAYPTFVRLDSLGTSPEGRPLWMLTVGGHADRSRPAVWVDGNMHASEVAGSSVALAIAEDVIALHRDPALRLHGLPAHACDTLRSLTFHILPRLSPDGAEMVLSTGRYVRSNPRDCRPNRHAPRWMLGDIDGDGKVFVMRKEDPGGDFVEAAEQPGLLVPRTLEDEGPFFRIYPEGTIDPWDGFTIPDPHFLSDNDTDLNRNFPYFWAHEPEQEGAGAHPLSAPEARSVVEFASSHPELFAWFNFHTFGGVHIRPLGNAPDRAMEPGDLTLFKQLGAWAEELTGYPMVSGYEEFLYKPEAPLRGALSDYAFHNRGCISYVTELWDLFRRMGIPRRKPFVDHYTHLTRADMVRIAQWDAKENHGRIMQPWRRVNHPQLGEVEVGGMDPRVGLWNPPLEEIDDTCRCHSALTLRVCALAPRVQITRTQVTPLGGDVRRVEVHVENHGYLPTYILASAKGLPFNEPLTIKASTEGCTLVEGSPSTHLLGHLEGWGRGIGSMGHAIFHQRSRGNANARAAQFLVRGNGALNLTVSSCRVGVFQSRIPLS